MDLKPSGEPLLSEYHKGGYTEHTLALKNTLQCALRASHTYTFSHISHHIYTQCTQEYIIELNSASTESQVKGSEPEPTDHTYRT